MTFRDMGGVWVWVMARVCDVREDKERSGERQKRGVRLCHV